jgi:hypothetical protein
MITSAPIRHSFPIIIDLAAQIVVPLKPVSLPIFMLALSRIVLKIQGLDTPKAVKELCEAKTLLSPIVIDEFFDMETSGFP